MSSLDDIKARLDIVDVVTDYVPELKRAGKNYHACCPFHQERTPSFVVFPDSQTWRCFGACATGGDLVSFVIKADAVDFRQALRSLGERAGVVIEDRRSSERQEHPLFAVNAAAQQFFREAFIADKGHQARAYAESRSLTEEAIVRFGIGYAPSTGEDLLRRLVAMGIDEDLIVQAGLAIRADDRPARDMFRGRLMFPLRDPDGLVMGFAGRSLDGSDPKYINTAQSPVFNKGEMLYAMDRAKEAITAEGTAVVVEGYMDVIAAHERGYRNVVASMGTALTERQVALLKSRAQRIVLALDADSAGQQAMLRSIKTSWNLVGTALAAGQRGREVLVRPDDLATLRVALITGGKDPDEIIRTDVTQWQRLIAEAVPAVEFLISAETAALDLDTAEGRRAAVEQLLPVIFAIPNWTEQERYFQRLADLVGIPTAALEAAIGARRGQWLVTARNKRSRTDTTQIESVFAIAERDPLEERVLALMAQHGEFLERMLEVEPDQFNRAENRAILSAIHTTGTIDAAVACLDGPLADLLVRLSQEELPPADRKQRAAEWTACLRRLEERHLRELKAQEGAAFAIDLSSDASAAPEYLEAIESRALETNERLRDLFVGEKN